MTFRGPTSSSQGPLKQRHTLRGVSPTLNCLDLPEGWGFSGGSSPMVHGL